MVNSSIWFFWIWDPFSSHSDNSSDLIFTEHQWTSNFFWATYLDVWVWFDGCLRHVTAWNFGKLCSHDRKRLPGHY